MSRFWAAVRNGTVACSLFSAYGPEPITTRLNLGSASVLVTTVELYRRKIEKMRDQLPDLRKKLLVADDGASCDGIANTLDLNRRMDEASEELNVITACGEDMALLHFTSGTTGAPKGAVHAHDAALTHRATGYYALDLHPDDVY